MRCSCAVESVILSNSKPLACLAVQINYCTNGEVVKHYYIARNVLSLRQSLEWCNGGKPVLVLFILPYVASKLLMKVTILRSLLYLEILHDH